MAIGEIILCYDRTISGMVDKEIPGWVPTIAVQYLASDKVKNGIRHNVRSKLDSIPINSDSKNDLARVITNAITSGEYYDAIFDGISEHHAWFSPSDNAARAAHSKILDNVRSELWEDALVDRGITNRIFRDFAKDQLGVPPEQSQNLLNVIYKHAEQEDIDKLMESILPDNFNTNYEAVKENVLLLATKILQTSPKDSYEVLRDCVFERTKDGFVHREGIDPQLKSLIETYLPPIKELTEQNDLKFKNDEEFLKYADATMKGVLNRDDGVNIVQDFFAGKISFDIFKQQISLVIFDEAKKKGIRYHKSVPGGIKTLLNIFSSTTSPVNKNEEHKLFVSQVNTSHS